MKVGETCFRSSAAQVLLGMTIDLIPIDVEVFVITFCMTLASVRST